MKFHKHVQERQHGKEVNLQKQPIEKLQCCGMCTNEAGMC